MSDRLTQEVFLIVLTIRLRKTLETNSDGLAGSDGTMQ